MSRVLRNQTILAKNDRGHRSPSRRVRSYRPQLELLEARLQPSPIHTGNVQVTDANGDPNLDRSESSLVVNPKDPTNMVGASKRFINPTTYSFTLAAYYTFNAGKTWNEAPP